MLAYDKDGKTVGKLSAEDTGDGTCQACMVKVNPEHQRKGLATSMYETLERKTKLKVIPDLEAQTKEGAAFWAQKKRKFGKSESLEKAASPKPKKISPPKNPESKLAKPKAPKVEGAGTEPEIHTVRGNSISPNPHIGGKGKGSIRPHLEDKGDHALLHLPIGSLPMYNPSNPHPLHQSGGKDLESLKDIYNSPKMREKHDRAMENYFKIESLCRQKKLPEEAVMHAVMFSIFSANSPVWNHELKYSRTNDLMNEYGITPMSSDFGNLKDRFLESDSPFDFPK
ncbi:MAG: N-acetyltransferase, partial [Proteobacteria bacterium]|nr:N-acetyltransferase [Pseudomonadota bacterium]